MATIHDSHLGVAEETTYGTAVAPTRFYEFVSEGIAGTYERIESEGFRAGQKVLRTDRFEVNPKGASGDLSLEVVDGSFGLWLKHALGAVSTGTAVATIYPHTFTVGDLKGKSLTTQINRVDASGAPQIFTYEGGKISTWELSNSVDGVLQLSLDLDFEKETIGAGAGAYAAATPTYVTGTRLFVFNGATVNVGGSSFAVSDITISGDNKLKTDRWFTNGGSGALKKEPLTEGLREVTWELTGEFDGLTHANRVAAAIASGALAAITCTWTGTGGTELSVSLPFARFDEGPVNFDGASIIEHALTGKALEDGTSGPITVVYKSKDATP